MIRDLRDPTRTARRFNVGATGPLRRLRDDGWIAAQRVRSLAPVHRLSLVLRSFG